MNAVALAAGTHEAGWLASHQVVKQARITYRKLDYWTRLGHLRPDHDGGSGTDRCWPPGEVQVACRVARLTDAGLPLAMAAEFARHHWPRGEIAAGIELRVSP